MNPADFYRTHQDKQADHAVIAEFLALHGLGLDDWLKVKQSLYSHNISSGAESDAELTTLWRSNSKAGKAMRLMSDWNEWQAKNELTPNDVFDYDAVMASVNRSTNWASFARMYDGADIAGSPERYKLWLDQQQKGEPVYYRKGDLDKAAISTTLYQRGARSGSSYIKPDRFFTFDEMKAKGYRLLSGLRGMVGVTSSDEGEAVWLNPDFKGAS